jgi:NADH:ubiquinone oxidoreductase subunit D
MLNMGPQHPSTHGVLRLVVTLDGENIVDVQPDIGYLHSSVEKMMEFRTYLQNIALVDRGMDYLTAMANEEVWVLATERLAKIEVPERAQYIRTIMLELQRISSHLIWWGTFGIDLGAFTAFLWAMRERERIMDLFEASTGGRLHHVYFRIGGVNEDLPDGWTERCAAFCDYFLARVRPAGHGEPHLPSADAGGRHPAAGDGDRDGGLRSGRPRLGRGLRRA